MKDLNEIMIFERVAHHGSFSKAAKDLGMPVSTVSRKVSDLEARLGITLIQRTTRKLNLTTIGTDYYQQCSDLLQGFDEAETRATQLQRQPEGSLRVSVPVGMASGAFMDFVAHFVKKYPRISLDLLITNQFVDLLSESTDVAIRFGELNDSSLIAKRLGVTLRLLVASPAYLKEHGQPKHPKDLVSHECLIYRSHFEDSLWELSKEKSRQRVKVSGRLIASDMMALRELAVRGFGVALLPEMYCVEDIREGHLKPLLPEWKSTASPVHAVYLNRRFMTGRLSVFLKELEMWPNPAWHR